MKFCGIICEFNPFHNGHKYLIDEAKKRTGSEIICLQSGDFVQRGEPAISDKYERAKNAVNAGAVCVLELPVIFATAPAEDFAMGAVKILDALGVNYLAFGIEKTNAELLNKVADLKIENSIRFKDAFKDEMKNGINYNTALKRAISKLLGEEYLEIMNKPNNVLAVEYIVAIKKLKSKIEIVPINRCDDGYNCPQSVSNFLSASQIRNKILNGEDYSLYIPKNANYTKFFAKKHLEMLKFYEFLKIKQMTAKEIGQHYDYNEGIENRVKSQSLISKNYDELKSKIITPRYREPRVNRLILYVALNIKKTDVTASKHSKPVSKVLAINKNYKSILSVYNRNKISLIVRNEDYEKLSSSQKKIIEKDLTASLIFNTIMETENSDKKIGTLFI